MAEAVQVTITPEAVEVFRKHFDQPEILDAMARAHDQEQSAQMGEPDLWAIRERGDWQGDDADWEVFVEERRAAMRQALKAVGLA